MNNTNTYEEILASEERHGRQYRIVKNDNGTFSFQERDRKRFRWWSRETRWGKWTGFEYPLDSDGYVWRNVEYPTIEETEKKLRERILRKYSDEDNVVKTLGVPA